MVSSGAFGEEDFDECSFFGFLARRGNRNAGSLDHIYSVVDGIVEQTDVLDDQPAARFAFGWSGFHFGSTSVGA